MYRFWRAVTDRYYVCICCKDSINLADRVIPQLQPLSSCSCMLWYPMYYPMEVWRPNPNPEPCAVIDAFFSSTPLRIRNHATGFKIISGDLHPTTAHICYLEGVTDRYTYRVVTGRYICIGWSLTDRCIGWSLTAFGLSRPVAASSTQLFTYNLLVECGCVERLWCFRGFKGDIDTHIDIEI